LDSIGGIDALFSAVAAPRVGAHTRRPLASGPGKHSAHSGGFYFIGIPHYLSTLTFYLGAITAPISGAPAGLLCRAAAHTGFRHGLWWGLQWHPLIKAGSIPGNIYHVSKQSAGILNIYRQLNGGPRTERGVALLAILSSTAAMALWPVHGHPSLVLMLAMVHPLFCCMDRLCLGVAVVSCSVLAWRIARRATESAS